MAQVLRLSAQEPLTVDGGAILLLKSQVGEERCRHIIEEATYHIIDRLSRIERAVTWRDLPTIMRLSVNLSSLCGQIGLDDFACVARDVNACAEKQDWPAIAAVTQRLVRIGEQSLFSALKLADHPDV